MPELGVVYSCILFYWFAIFVSLGTKITGARKGLGAQCSHIHIRQAKLIFFYKSEPYELLRHKAIQHCFMYGSYQSDARHITLV